MDNDIKNEVVDQVLDPGKINISQDVSTHLPIKEVLVRVHHHFQHSDFNYRQLSRDTFQLRAKSRKYPLFGSFVGNIHVFERLPPKARHDYAIEGLLEYRMSLLWFIAVLSFFFILNYVFQPGFWVGVAIEAFGTALVMYWTHELGKNEEHDVEERLEASFLSMRTTIENLR